MTIISKRKTHITMAVLFVFLIFLDQLTKKIASMYLIGNDVTIIPNILELHYLENKGAAWGRFWHHYVVDFIYVSAIDFPVFNVADCYVTIAAVLLLYALIFRYKDDFEKED